MWGTEVHIRGWLTGLIVFLLAPCLLFASLWFHSKFEDVNSIDRSLAGLNLIQALGPLMQEKALTGTVKQPTELLVRQLADFDVSAREQSLVADLSGFMNEQGIPDALRKARSLASSIAQHSRLSSSSSFETSEFPHLINDTLLSVVIETSVMVNNGEMLAGKDAINTWDKMLVPVQAGQFKVAADTASRATKENFMDLQGPKADSLRDKAAAYRSANLAYQSAGSKLLSSTIKGTTGADIANGELNKVQPDFVRAIFNLWQETVDYLHADLQHQRAETMFAVALAGLVGGLVIIAAFAIAVALSRALADRTQQEFENLGFHDPLTGLPNRRALLKTLRGLSDRETPNRIGLVILDLRHFKKINDLFGDQSGDSILRDVAEQLVQFAEAEDFLCRTGGTEFMLLRPDLTDSASFEDTPARIIRELGRERQIEGQKLVLESNAGLLISNAGDPITDQLLVDAELALRSAKQKAPRKVERFTSEMRVAFEENGEIAKQLLRAMNNGEIVPWFQPQVDVHTGEIIGAEALVRWLDHQTVRFPGYFLPAAEEAGYMDRIEAIVRQKTLELASEFTGKTRRTVHFGLNISADLLSNASAVGALHRHVLDAGLNPSMISLEILEAVMIDEDKAKPIKENIAHLSDLGFFIELDDFGTGHSSISSLRDLKIDRVKIDRSFVSGVDTNKDLQKFTSALINLAKSLDISVLAEGVETPGERDWLARNGCDVIQGFLVSKAVPEVELAAMILKKNFTVQSNPFFNEKSATA
ncbi:bifunctional diguanylate cyclase/phosphodiesterase [Roseibium sp. HPY-6]|uniref:putative bifunctional diguanylate cyclase/phosphodiesterase n=1 Tax=Roseibium sp. HPY-6 TaxID=3229852 RepID=UPI00338F91BE